MLEAIPQSQAIVARDDVEYSTGLMIIRIPENPLPVLLNSRFDLSVHNLFQELDLFHQRLPLPRHSWQP